VHAATGASSAFRPKATAARTIAVTRHPAGTGTTEFHRRGPRTGSAARHPARLNRAGAPAVGRARAGHPMPFERHGFCKKHRHCM
jgi:hypothetical protein